MDKRFEQMLHQGRYMDGNKGQEDIVNTMCHQRNEI